MNNTSELLKTFFSKEQPLGPVVAQDHLTRESMMAFHAYFDRENNAYQELRRSPTMIVGRKGSGKTDFLLSYTYDTKNSGRSNYDPIVFFNAVEASNFLSSVMGQVEMVLNTNFRWPLVETISEFWSGLFWVTIISKIVHREHLETDAPGVDVLEAFLTQYGIDEEMTKNPYEVILHSIVMLRERYEFSRYVKAGVDFFSSLPGLDMGPITLKDAKNAALNWLRGTRKQAIILFDSVEAIDLDSQDNSLIISALLRAIGSFEQVGIPTNFRCCIPAESYHRLLEISSNTLKDFQSTLLLQWKSGELLRIAAKRYYKYLTLWHADSMPAEYGAFDLSTRSGSIDFWKYVLPDVVPNARNNQYEETLTYILRHSQLLPRHVLSYLNNIMSRSVANLQGRSLPEVTADDVVTAVRETEKRIVEQVLDSYAKIWPNAGLVLDKLFRNLGKNIISYEELHHQYNQTGLKRTADLSYAEVVKMLSELGAIGRLLKTGDRYAISVFEYAEPSRLSFHPGDLLSIHPAFSDCYGVIPIGDIPESYLPVYPLGSDPNAQDKSQEMSWV